MKHTFKTLLGLVLVVFVLAGCSNPAGPEFSEIDKTTVVETPEESIRQIEVKFEWGKDFEVGNCRGSFKMFFLGYLLGLHPTQDFDGYKYAYDLPEEYVPVFLDLFNEEDEERFRKLSNDALKLVFDTAYYKEGDIIDLGKYTSRAVCLANPRFADCLRFSTKDIDETEKLDFKDIIEVCDTDMVIYVFWDSDYSGIKN